MGTATIEIGPEARIRRFWRAHARSLAHVGVIQAFCVGRTVAWTPERVAGWYGIRVDRARAAARELAACGILRRAEGEQEAYRWSSALDWVDPTSPACREIMGVAQTIKNAASAGFAEWGADVPLDGTQSAAKRSESAASTQPETVGPAGGRYEPSSCSRFHPARGRPSPLLHNRCRGFHGCQQR